MGRQHGVNRADEQPVGLQLAQLLGQRTLGDGAHGAAELAEAQGAARRCHSTTPFHSPPMTSSAASTGGVVRAVGGTSPYSPRATRSFTPAPSADLGTDAELHLVDARIAGRKAATLDHAGAAALPLTSITARELLFEGLRVPEGAGAGEALLVVGGAGGVGSILIQIARALTGLTVVVTACTRANRARPPPAARRRGYQGTGPDSRSRAPSLAAPRTSCGPSPPP